MQVSFGSNIKDSKDLIECSLADIFDYMGYSDKLLLDCLDIRNQGFSDDDKRKKKSKLPYFCSSTFKTPVRKNSDLKKAELMILDIDKLQIEKLAEIKTLLKKEPFVHFSFISPSGAGLKVGLKFNKPITDPEIYTHNYKIYANQFSKFYGVEIDNTHDASRACFLSLDEDLYYNAESLPLNVVYPKKETRKEFKVEVSEDETIERARQLCQKCNIRLSYEDWYKCGSSLASLGHIGEDLFVLLSTGNGSKDSIQSIRRKYRSLESLERVGIGTFFHIMKRNGVNL